MIPKLPRVRFYASLYNLMSVQLSSYVGLFTLVLISGCGFQQDAVSVPGEYVVKGIVYGGQRPISNSLMQLYAVDSKSLINPLISESVRSDQAGSFSLSIVKSCPSPDSLVYIVANGGNPGLAAGMNNPAIELMAALGTCRDLSTHAFVTVNEVTTVGSILPLSAYAKSSAQIGPRNGDITQYEAAIETVDSLIDIASGNIQNTMLVPENDAPALRLNTLANILSSCVMTEGGTAADGSICGQLFSLTTFGSSVPPTTTLMAALAIGQDPSRNVDRLFALSSQNSHFTPALTSPPLNWIVQFLRLPASPVISPTPGTYASGQLITIATTSSGSVIYYTLDGTTPSGASSVYRGPITLLHSETVRAIASTGQLRSLWEASATYKVSLPVSITLSPGGVTLQPSQTQQFTALVTNATNTGVNWTLSPAVGSLSPSGLYTAPVTIGAAQKVTVTVTSQADPTKTASASIALAPSVSVTLSPGGVTLQPSQTQQFTDSVTNATNTGVNWTLSPAVGSLSPSGLYTAPATIMNSQTVTVTATSVADKTKTAVATVSLQPTIGISEQAQSALRFIDSMGVNTHFGYIDTGYGNASFVASEVEKLGVKHVRDGAPLVVSPTNYPNAYNAILQMGAAGIRFAAGYGVSTDNPYVLSFPASVFQAGMARMTVNGTAYIEAFEGKNEVDVTGTPHWAEDWATNQTNLIAGDTMDVPLYSTSLAFAANFPGNIPTQSQNAAIPIYGNIHPYAGNAMPGVVWPTELNQIRSSFPSSFPIVATEAGYYDATASGMGFVDADTQAKYIPRTFLENFRAGIYRTYIYELLDEVSTWNSFLQESHGPNTCVQCSYGMITAGGTEKPSFIAVKNLISILGNGATPDSTGSLVYSIAGGNANLHHVLLQKSPGVFDLILWQEISSFNTTTSTAIANAALPIKLSVAASSVSTYNPSVSTAPVPQTMTGFNVGLQVPDQALLVEITTTPK